MNLFDFLKNKHGKLTLGLPQMVAIAGVGLVASYGAFHADKKAAEQEQIRSLSSISSGYNYGGMRQTGRGGLTSINVKDGLNQVATAEERARMEAGRTGGGDFGLSAADNLGNSVGSSLVGRAAATSDTEGLGMGKNAVIIQEGTPTGTTANGARVNPGAVSGRTGRNGRTDTSAGDSRLASASVTRAGGSGMSASYGGASAGNNTGNTMAGAPTGRSGEGYKFSGAMPSGTDPLSLSGANGRTSSTFMAGGRNATTGRGSRSKGTGNELKDISKRSADAALNRNRAANEGSRAFLAAAVNSGGMSIDGGVETQETGSADFAAPELSHLKAIGDWGDKTNQETVTPRDKARKNLLYFMIATMAATLLAFNAIRYLMKMADAGGVYTQGFRIAGWVLTGIICAAAGLLIAHAIRYAALYGFGWMAGGAMTAGAACIAAALVAALGKGKKDAEFYKQKMAGDLKQGLGMAVTKVGGALWNKVANDDGNSSNQS